MIIGGDMDTGTLKDMGMNQKRLFLGTANDKWSGLEVESIWEGNRNECVSGN